MSKHLDLGCGKIPRNPLNQSDLYGIDIRDLKITNFNYKKCNLISQKIPYPDNYFDSISAFDFIEHVPRIWIKSENETIFPFINLMNEIYRVLKNNGVFLAITPAYPSNQAFQDPTHVNFITKRTAKYFSGKKPLGKIYGFKGNFLLKENIFVPNNYFEMKFSSLISENLYLLYSKIKNKNTHLYWNLKKIG
jgi:SAM-dependent methyltransferase